MVVECGGDDSFLGFEAFWAWKRMESKGRRRRKNVARSLEEHHGYDFECFFFREIPSIGNPSPRIRGKSSFFFF